MRRAHALGRVRIVAMVFGLICEPALAMAQAEFPSAAPPAAAAPVAPRVDEPPQPHRAPTRARHWTFGVRGGLGLATNPSGGSSTLPALGTVLVPAGDGIGAARAVSSWLFGDGAAQLNSAAASFVVPVPPLPALDGSLTALGATRRAGGALGVSIGRDLSTHLSADFRFDANFEAFAMTSATTTALEAARAGFAATWNALLSDTTAPSTTATTSGATSGGRQLETSGTITYHFEPAASLDPFVIFGAGLVTSVGSGPAVTLTGHYQFTLVAGGLTFPFNETDLVTVHMTDAGSRVVGIFGGGVVKTLSASTGLRFAVELAVGSNQAETTIDATPTSQLGAPSARLFIPNATTTIIIGNEGMLRPSTLSGPALTGFQTFVGKGTRIQPSITVGYFFRF